MVLFIQALILLLTLLVFALGKSPVFRVDRAGAAIIGAVLTVSTGVISFDQAAQSVDYRTIILLFSMMIMAAYLNLSGFFQLAGN
ncbi:MAG: anion transporter, partial [Bacillota bacterium]|nr:anion transporter [Bacillota bacterium]